MKKIEDDNAIIVSNVTKSFKLFYDKPSTLKERLVFWNKKKSTQYKCKYKKGRNSGFNWRKWKWEINTLKINDQNNLSYQRKDNYKW